jgi:drug/metabolite transporter (DMT)-like permease
MEATGGQCEGHSRAWLWAAFIALYIAWGSTYLAIRVAIETLPPLLMAGARFLTAGGILYIGVRATGTARPSRANWFSAVVIGAFLLLAGNGGVVWAEKTVPSGVTALLVGATPFWMVLINWLAFRAARPTWRTVLGLVLGFIGLYILVAPGGSASERIDPLGAALITMATLSWTIGSLYSKRANLPSSPMLASGMQMVCGGALLFAAGLVHGEFHTMHLAAVSLRSWLALAYLAIVGSLVGFSAYVYVLKHATPAKASTYAYVNPVVAVIMGWVVAGEPIGFRTLAAGVGIVAAVVLITTAGRGAAGKGEPEGELCEAETVAA